MNSIIEAQREFEEQRLKIRLLELRNLKVQSARRVGKTHLLARALAMSGIKLETKPNIVSEEVRNYGFDFGYTSYSVVTLLKLK